MAEADVFEGMEKADNHFLEFSLWPDGKPLWIGPDIVLALAPAQHGGTCLYLSHGYRFEVREPISEVRGMVIHTLDEWEKHAHGED